MNILQLDAWQKNGFVSYTRYFPALKCKFGFILFYLIVKKEARRHQEITNKIR